jgi:hypothetical protein
MSPILTVDASLAVKEATKAVEDVVDSSWHWMVLPPS